MARWCTVSVTERNGRRHSIDVLADSSYDAAHIFVAQSKSLPYTGLPKPTLTTIFETVIDGKVLHVQGEALQRWIIQQHLELSGAKGMLFKKRPTLA